MDVLPVHDEIAAGNLRDQSLDLDLALVLVVDAPRADAAVVILEAVDVDDAPEQLGERGRIVVVERGVVVDVHDRGGDAEIAPVDGADAAAEVRPGTAGKLAPAVARKVDHDADDQALVETGKAEGGVDSRSGQVEGRWSLRRPAEREPARGVGLRGQVAARNLRLECRFGATASARHSPLQREPLLRRCRRLIARDRRREQRHHGCQQWPSNRSRHLMTPGFSRAYARFHPRNPRGPPRGSTFQTRLAVVMNRHPFAKMIRVVFLCRFHARWAHAHSLRRPRNLVSRRRWRRRTWTRSTAWTTCSPDSRLSTRTFIPIPNCRCRRREPRV